MPTKKLTKKNQKFATFKLGSDTLRITETEDGVEARIIAENGDDVTVFAVRHEERRIAGHIFDENVLYTAYDFNEPMLRERVLLDPTNRPSVVMRDGRLYCKKCHCWVPNTANAEMRKEGCYAHSHVCGIRADGEVYEDASDSERS